MAPGAFVPPISSSYGSCPYRYKLCDIFNMDETGLFYGVAPDRGLSDHKQSGVKGKKIRLTYTFTSNAVVSKKLLPLVIGKAAWLQAFNKKTGTQLGFHY
ncbi:DDE-domain-containing protein [Tricholoma matsutake]|nr:DDE-domain-containing protein [Tricholoma matsutake 945]